ncbi:M15 family metallopeptidase [Cardinium endosymbiont of Culicoides punctatus]|uniref:M15 family metallopeptidase n=1 Tax=Cardinium endosymbiont of Culicoides punctatus TaxID=2304601 RepID=UPI001058DAD6|nr:M15 family metallopeptidase [Cardinium endosymbiont of Culicoides punctatus]TDG95647.1 D-alanyl-D-alanine dipeptidase [Cardinium endosymbiont of Culicoides punctatus]
MILKKNLNLLIVIAFAIMCKTTASAEEAKAPWSIPVVNSKISTNVLYLPIADDRVKTIPIQDCDEVLIDLLVVNHPRIKSTISFDKRPQKKHSGYAHVRLGVYKKLLAMLDFLPKNVGIAYFEAFRPLSKQKQYFDRKFREILSKVQNKEIAYQEASKYVSPFIDNIPPHVTGAAIDMMLFVINGQREELMDMGTCSIAKNQHETFSEKTSKKQRENRLILLHAAIQAGFINYGFEWWHYSYGDKAWAYVKQQEAAIYGLIAAPNEIPSMDKDTYLKNFN